MLLFDWHHFPAVLFMSTTKFEASIFISNTLLKDMDGITRPFKRYKPIIDTQNNQNTSDGTSLLYKNVKLNNPIEEVAIM